MRPSSARVASRFAFWLSSSSIISSSSSLACFSRAFVRICSALAATEGSTSFFTTFLRSSATAVLYCRSRSADRARISRRDVWPIACSTIL